MKTRLLCVAAAAAALVALTAVTHGNGAEVGFVDASRSMKSHPLYGVLGGYDREIAALRATQNVGGLTNPAERAQRAAVSLRRESDAAMRRVRPIATRAAVAERGQEEKAVSEISALRAVNDRDAAALGVELARETVVTIGAFRTATAQRIECALEARRTQLHEKELTLAFELARRDGGRRLHLRLKLASVYLSDATRRALRGQLAALDRREADAIAALQREDAAVLASYRDELESSGAAANAQMTSQLDAKANANLATRRSVLQAQRSATAALPNLSAQLALFRSTYPLDADAAALNDALRKTRDEVSARFDRLSETDRQSRAATASEIATLERDRDALYRSILAQIQRVAQRLARDRHLAGVVVAGSRPDRSVDLTAAVRSQLALKAFPQE